VGQFEIRVPLRSLFALGWLIFIGLWLAPPPFLFDIPFCPPFLALFLQKPNAALVVHIEHAPLCN
jgi:hypothetical protein